MTDPTTPVEPTASQKAVGGLQFVKNLVTEVATLKRPVTAAAVATFVLTLIPGVGLSAEEVAAILVGVGTLDAALSKIA